jgi:hypothetical protein
MAWKRMLRMPGGKARVLPQMACPRQARQSAASMRRHRSGSGATCCIAALFSSNPPWIVWLNCKQCVNGITSRMVLQRHIHDLFDPLIVRKALSQAGSRHDFTQSRTAKSDEPKGARPV